MRVALMSLLMMMTISTGCALNCNEACEEDYQDCLDQSTPAALCKSTLGKCKSRCDQNEQAWDDESESDCSISTDSLDAAISSGRIPIWIFLVLGFVRRIRT
jgi:hypothetical protein